MMAGLRSWRGVGAGLRRLSGGATVRPSSSGSALSLSAAREKRVSKAMTAYLEEARKNDEFMAKEQAEFELGRRHLANMMSLDPEEMSQADVDEAIEYLFPSALVEPRARPILKPPERLWPKKKKPEFGMDGRPFHSFFYTLKPNFYQILHEIATKVERVRQKEATAEAAPGPIDVRRTEWISKEALLKRTMEPLEDADHQQLLAALNLLLSLPFAALETEFINRFRQPLAAAAKEVEYPVPRVQKCPETGREFVEAEGSRKMTRAKVRMWLGGRGRMELNGIPLSELPGGLQHREQLLAPLILLDRLGSVDVETETWQPQSDDKSCVWHLRHTQPLEALSAKSGAARLGLARALTAIVSSEETEQMRLAGLLSQDPRTRMRHRPGYKGAKAKYRWQKR